MTTPRPDSRLGTDLGPYRIERVLGRGGMGVVYLAEQHELGRTSGKAWIYWTDGKTRVYGWASAPDGDRAALYDWWRQTAPFILPPEDT